MGEHIFISYRSVEAAFSLKIAADLKNRGIPIWMDRLETGIRGGDDWRQAIESAINACAAMIAVLSPDYVHAEYCRNEMARANRLKRAILPILLHPIPDEDWPIELERVQYVDFRAWQDEAGYSRSFEELLAILRAKAGTRPGAVPDLETQYLTNLIAELEARRGVLEYVDLSAQTRVAERPNPHLGEGWDAEFTLLLPGDARPALPQRVPLADIRAAVEQHPRFVLIGEPGAGKTTTLRRLALEAARERLANPRMAPLPLLLYLPQWESKQEPLEFIAAHYPFKPDGLAQLLASGDLLLFLDGLNEMGGEGVSQAQKLYNWLHHAHSPRRVIVTCRADDYTGSFDLNLPTVFVEALDEKRIRQFAQNYLADRAEAFLQRILPAEPEDRHSTRALFQLARNPYLLAALVYVYSNTPGGDLPRNVGALFRGLAQALWSRERTKQTPDWIPFDQMEAAFARLAFVMVDEHKPIDVPEDFAVAHIGDKSLLRAGSSASLFETRSGQVRFYHQLMQEYFAAVGLLSAGLGAKIESPRFGFGGRIPGKWDEVIPALCGIAPDPDAVLRQLLLIDSWLAVRGMESGVPASDSLRQAILAALLKGLEAQDWSERASAARALGRLGDQAAVPALIKTLDDQVWYVSRMAKQALEKLGGPNVADIMKRDLTTAQGIAQVGPYQLLEPLGRGGMAEVHRAIHTELGREVALKIIRVEMSDPAPFIQRFMRESAVLAGLKHPHIVPLLDYGHDARRVYLANQLLTGGSLAERLRGGALSLDMVRRVIAHIASALDYAHGAGLLHRDLRPANVLFDAQGSAYMADLGVNRVMTDSAPLTATGTLLGTPSYLSPEQWQGKVLTTTTDIYALGIMLFEMLAGRPPFEADTPFALLYQHLSAPIPSIGELRPDLPAGLQPVLDKALAKEASRRFTSAGALAAAFEHLWS